MKNAVLIIGATSSIARGAAEAFAKKGHPLYLAGRNRTELKRIAADLRIRYNIPVYEGLFDADDLLQHPALLQDVLHKTKELEGALLAVGELGDHKKALHDAKERELILTRNYSGPVSIFSLLANHFSEKERGFLVGISSVAGDRGRQSNYLYGSAKGGFSLFLQGLRQRLHPRNVHVMTVKPGFVDTAMIYHLSGLPFVADPKKVGEGIVRALEKKKNVVYLPGFWRAIMSITCSIPESLFKRLSL